MTLARLYFTLAALALVPARSLHAEPYIPSKGSQVVERLPSRIDPVQRELAAMRTLLSKNPNDPALAATLARRYIEQARMEGDPRYLGYAEAALAPWWKQAAPPDDVLVLRATLRQSTHQFPAALADLDAVVKRNPDNVQAWLTRATVQSITGNFTGAKASCMRLHSRVPELVVQTCLSEVGSVSGDARGSYDKLEQALARHPSGDQGVRIWAVTLLAEMAARIGDDTAAEKYFRQALAFDAADSYLLAAWADFLLDHGRAAEVVKLLADKTRADALLLRHALALKATSSPKAAQAIGALRARFDAAMLRGDTVHQREQARFELSLRNNPQAAVRLAKLNWAVQKEPADLRILADTAVASGDREAAALVRGWLQKSRIEDSSIASLKQLKAGA